MTGLLHERDLSRKTFLKAGGALVVGFSAAGSLLSGKASAAAPTSAGYLPDLSKVDSWLSINADNTATLKTSQIETGNGITTGFLMVAAEELNMDMSQMHYARQDTWVVASTGGEGGSNAISGSSPKVRLAAVTAYNALLNLASANLGVPAAQLSVKSGVVSGGGKTVTYGALVGGKLINATIPGNTATTGLTLAPGTAPSKPMANYTVVGTSPPRIDIPAKVNGTYTYVHNIRVPGMLHGRVVRPRGQGGVTSTNYVPLSVNANSISHIPGAKVVQLSNFVGVVAPKEYDAIQAAAQLEVTWKSDPKLAGSGNFWKTSRQQADALPARYSTDTGGVPAKLAGSAKTVTASYRYQYNGHMPIGPSCAVADVTSSGATIYCNAQSIQSIPTNLGTGLIMPGATTPYLGLTNAQIRAVYYEGSSTYGAAPSELHDPEQAAAIMSKIVGAPVRVQYMRWDEHGYDNYGPPEMMDVTGGVDSSGNMTALDWTTYIIGGAAVTPTFEATGAGSWAATQPTGAASTTDTIYKVATTGKRVLAKNIPLYSGGFRNSYLRAPNGQQAHFASEQIVDELAHASNMDPIAFRQQNIDATQITGQKWIAAMNAATSAANWKPKVANSAPQTGNIRTGRGFGFGTFASTQCAMVADISVNIKSGKITAKHLYMASNTGFTVSPGLVANQMTGGAIMGLSRALYEQLTFTKERITSLDWVTYPILRFADAPLVTTVIVFPNGNITINPGTNQANIAGNAQAIAQGWSTTGAGEPGTVPPGSAVANAFFDATGVRIRSAPMTASVVRATLKAAGVS
ncbi:MAG TPA: molybdopterin cofactor-binding domain-containing protein [Gaiellaceae bacterium]|jgi:CO/xanthine dehydrogenase Mo-binding subunit|nr:molybdopterin cofactor-binding domain-containing protein [Gaiellaceae bacterium]